MKHSRRFFLHLAAGAAALPAGSRVAWAQPYPTRLVRVIVPFGLAGATDIVARLIGRWLSERLGQPFVIENRPGVNTNLGVEAVVRAPPDGYTLVLAGAPSAINATFYDKLSFNFIRDIAPVAAIIRFPNVVVVNLSVPVKTIPELIAYAKANPGKLNLASPGSGSTPHLAGVLFNMMTGVDMVHVPYRSTAALITDLLSEQVQVFFGTTAAITEYVRTGIGAPRNTAGEIVDKLNAVIDASLADPKLKARFADLGGVTLAGSPADFGRLIAEETEKWAKVVKFSGAKAEERLLR
jgi:tripartite-type tricarboxylate transporter receptor subunit TctC